MLNNVKKYFRILVEITLWIILIGSPLVGFMSGYTASYYGRNQFLYGLLGLVIGAIVGVLTCVLSGGMIAIYIKIEEHLDTQKQNQIKQATEITDLLTKIEKHLETQRQNQIYLGKNIIPSLETIENHLEALRNRTK